jgi:hypothetical protein
MISFSFICLIFRKIYNKFNNKKVLPATLGISLKQLETTFVCFERFFKASILISFKILNTGKI